MLRVAFVLRSTDVHPVFYDLLTLNQVPSIKTPGQLSVAGVSLGCGAGLRRPSSLLHLLVPEPTVMAYGCLGPDNDEGRRTATTSKEGSRRANYPILTQGGSDKK